MFFPLLQTFQYSFYKGRHSYSLFVKAYRWRRISAMNSFQGFFSSDTTSVQNTSRLQINRKKIDGSQSSGNNPALKQAAARARKKPRKVVRVLEDDGIGICAAYCLPSNVDLQVISRELSNFPQCTLDSEQIPYANDVVHATVSVQPTSADRAETIVIQSETSKSSPTTIGHLFVFESGALVFWGVPFYKRSEIFNRLLETLRFSLATAMTLSSKASTSKAPFFSLHDFDHEFDYYTGSSKTKVENDEIHLMDIDDKLELMAISYCLAQSVKLLLYEEEIDTLVNNTWQLPLELAQTGSIRMSRKDIKKRIGELLAARYRVNLLSDLLDAPDLFWQFPDLEILRSQCFNTVDFHKRTRLLNNRMEIIKDALDILNTELTATSSHRVEQFIVLLIAIEVGFEITKLF
ncbi:uncharacterized protein Gasu_19900 [Galdieria sulphuraria]|uniref:DUF155 domain-containing protein n=1 Tax=Galdieria sulphuraria TaxID=130081 RepID=M2W4T5_GALSU|nr:uncharacterized protein Gasu_19900 [Galdieria sulphuraria]EME30751.1 hypothetical protein Gasu_19900 [Galdieria sulphuraria]|eukprot:XP_005707271.1 hypothetical protein Gasu_19900 [Galdieria sulphuraria]